MTGSTRIPRKLHQIWFDKHDRYNSQFPNRKYQEYANTWKSLNPGWEYRCWSLDQFESLFLNRPEVASWIPIWNRLRFHIEKCDVARYILLYLEGGCYVDADFWAIRPLEELLRDFPDHDLILGNEPSEHREINKNLDPITNAFMLSKPYHPFWEKVLHEINNKYIPNGEVVMNTGPGLLGKLDPPRIDGCYLIPDTKYGARSTDCTGRNLEIGSTRWNEGTQWAWDVQGLDPVWLTRYPWVVFGVFLITLVVTLWRPRR